MALFPKATILACLLSLSLFVFSPQSHASDLLSAQPEHELLQRMVGNWKFVKKSSPATGEPEVVGTGTISAELIGEFFVVSRWRGLVYEVDFEAVQTIGYDVREQKYIGTWADSIMTHLWHFAGPVSEAENTKTLTLQATGPSPGGAIATFRERYLFRRPDSITVIAEMKTKGGTWQQFMTTELTRAAKKDNN